MNKKSFRPASVAGFVLSAALLPLLFGCVVDSGRSMRVHTPPVYVESVVIVEDDYVYYPGYEVYYSSNRHQYVYRDGRNWVTRPAPPRVQLDVFLASPSVRVDFRDAPERHHAEMVRRYPRNWRESENRNEVRKEEHKDDRREDKHNGRKGDHDDDNRRHD